MQINGQGSECRLIEFKIMSTCARFQNSTINDPTKFVPFEPDAEIIFRDTREIDHLISMLEEVKRTNDRFLGKFERV